MISTIVSETMMIGRKDKRMILEFEHVTGNSKKFHLEDISFSLPAGYIMGLAGKNGAGKTTLIDYIVNPKKQYQGSIKIAGEDIHSRHTYINNKIGFISEENQFLKERSAMQNAEILSVFYQEWDMDLFRNALKKMELSEKRVVGKMSRGELMKFQMAFAMAHRPVLYLLDEATAGMDPVFRIDFFKMLHEVIATEEASVLMTSHIQDEMAQKMDYVGVLERGRISSFGEGIDILK